MWVYVDSQRLKFYLQRNTHGTEKLRQGDFLKARAGNRPVNEGPDTGTGQVGWGSTTAPERPTEQNNNIMNGHPVP